MNLKIQFLLPVSEKFETNPEVVPFRHWYFLPATEATCQSRLLLDDFLQTKSLAENHIMGGFAIEIEEKSWNQYYFGQISQSMEWITGLKRLLMGEKVVMISVFDDSRLLLQRHENIITLYETWDDYYPRTDLCPEIKLDFHDFLQKFIDEALQFAALTEAMQKEMQKVKNVLQQPQHSRFTLIEQAFKPAYAEKVLSLQQTFNRLSAESPER